MLAHPPHSLVLGRWVKRWYWGKYENYQWPDLAHEVVLCYTFCDYRRSTNLIWNLFCDTPPYDASCYLTSHEEVPPDSGRIHPFLCGGQGGSTGFRYVVLVTLQFHALFELVNSLGTKFSHRHDRVITVPWFSFRSLKSMDISKYFPSLMLLSPP